MSDNKIKWRGGRYGECPYIILGNKKYFIKDRYRGKDKYDYALMELTLGEGFDYEFRPSMSDWQYGEFLRAVRIFERWYRIKFGSKPLQVCDDNGQRRYEKGHLVFWVDKPYGKPPRITCRSLGRIVIGHYDTMKECKYYAERILLKEIERYNETQNTQIQMDFNAITADMEGEDE